jgi:uncharacterized protein YndB with AHSA1/START domain
MKTIATLVCLLPLAAASLATAATDPIVTEAVIDAPLATVWGAWTTKPDIESWMTARTEIDLKVGGLWRTSYDKSSKLDDDTTIHQRILSYDPQRMMAIRTEKTPRNFPFPTAILKTWTVIYFEPVQPAQTRVTVRMLGFDDDAESQKMRAFFITGNQATLASLARKFRP